MLAASLRQAEDSLECNELSKSRTGSRYMPFMSVHGPVLYLTVVLYIYKISSFSKDPYCDRVFE